MIHTPQGYKPGLIVKLGLLLLASIVATSAHAEAGLITFDAYRNGSVNGLSMDGSIAAGYIINATYDDEEAFIWNQANGVVPLGYLDPDKVSAGLDISDDGLRIFADGFEGSE